MHINSEELTEWLKSLILENQENAVVANKSYVAAEAFYNKRKVVEIILDVVSTGYFETKDSRTSRYFTMK